MFEILKINIAMAQEAETLPSCLSNETNMMVKFQLPRPTGFGFRVFKNLGGLVFAYEAWQDMGNIWLKKF